MPFKFYAPGERKGNKTIVARGSIAGKTREFATGKTDPKAARRVALDLKARLEADAPNPGKVTFAEAARRYVEFRKPSRVDRLRISRAVDDIGSRLLGSIKPADVHDVAMRLCDRASVAATRNREVVRPILTVLHHAADAGLCNWLKVKAFPEPPRKPRALDLDTAAKVIAAAPAGPKRRLIVWLFNQGTRISETLRVAWHDVHLDRGCYVMFNTKADRTKERALSGETIAELECVSEEDRTGPVFPWQTKSGVYKWLRPLMVEAGVPFTPHMARHTLGTVLNANGEGLRTIMEALDHSQASSSLIYQKGDVQIVRSALERVKFPQPKKLGKAS